MYGKNKCVSFAMAIIAWLFIILFSLLLFCAFASAQAITSIWSAGAVSTANTFQVALPQSYLRHGCQIQNTSSGVEFIGTASTPTVTNTDQIQPGQPYNCLVSGSAVDQANVWITSATVGSTYVVTTW